MNEVEACRGNFVKQVEFWKNVHILATLPKQPQLPVAVSGLKTIGGAEGDRTPDLRIANAALCQTELLPHVGREYRFKFHLATDALNDPDLIRTQLLALLLERL
jgi:hypothetical protein